ncbi:MAG: hypothetical protein QXI19_10290 [Candidatus Caldarchaeum sp.]
MRKVMALLTLFVLVLALSCAKPPKAQVLYSGALSGDFASSEKLLGYYAQVKACMGVTEDITPPALVVYEGESVVCDGKVKRGCYTPGTVHLPVNTSSAIIKHEFIHHILWAKTGDLDPSHKSEWFGRCGGIEVVYE